MSEISKSVRVAYLHHSTGNCIWQGGVEKWFADYNAANDTDIELTEMAFPKSEPYGWQNYPYDYWNIWVNNAGDELFMDEPTLEILTKKYNLIVFKHCFPVSDILPDSEGEGKVSDKTKTLQNYRLQYAALKDKLAQYPDCRFVVWTCAALTEAVTTEDKARRAAEFSAWVRDEWASDADNIFVWDFFNLETGGGLYLKGEYANGEKDSHPNEEFSSMAAPKICEKIVEAAKTL